MRDLYHWVMMPSELMTERRQAYELKNHTGKLSVMYLSTTPDLESSLVPVRIPVDRNLGGYFTVRLPVAGTATRTASASGRSGEASPRTDESSKMPGHG